MKPHDQWNSADIAATPDPAKAREGEPAPVSTEQQSATDYCYNRNDWEITFEWDDRDMLVEHMMPGEVMEVGTLQQGPTLWVAEYENGDDDRETRWFDNEADARAIAEGKDDE